MRGERAPYIEPFRPQDILNYPYVGSPVTQILEENENPAALVYSGAGVSGVVRRLWFLVSNGVGADALNDLPANAELKIWTGLGTLANSAAAPNETTYPPDATISMQNLLGARYDSSTAPKTPRQSSILESVLSQDASGITVCLTLSIPFTNGILIQYQEGDAVVTVAYSVAEMETADGLPSSSYPTWRLKAQTYSGVIARLATATWLNVTSGGGMLVGVFGSMLCSINNYATFLENNWVLRPNGAGTDVWQTSGSEDLFSMGSYYFDAGVFSHRESGLYYKVNRDASNPETVEFYRLFTLSPVIFKNGIVGRWVRDNGQDDTTSNVTVNLTTLYYAP